MLFNSNYITQRYQSSNLNSNSNLKFYIMKQKKDNCDDFKRKRLKEMKKVKKRQYVKG